MSLIPFPAPSPIDDVYDLFLRGRSIATAEAYRSDLEAFARYLALPDGRHAAHALLSHGAGHANRIVIEYKADLIEQGFAPKTINRRLATLRSLCKRARIIGRIDWSLEVDDLPVTPYRDTRGPRETGFRKLLHQANLRTDTKGIRDMSILLLLHDVALRRGEVIALDLQDVDPYNESISVRGKGKLEKTAISLPPRTWEALGAWIQVRGTNPGPLFTNLHRSSEIAGTRLTSTSLYRIIRDLGADTDVKVTPHGLRHTAITKAVEQAQIHGIDLSKVLPYSRHADLKTLQIYADRHENWQGRVAELVAR